MATKTDRAAKLRKEAREAASFRGHELEWRTDEFAICRLRGCRATVTVDPDPLPNGSEIAGSAVAVTCYGAET